MYYDPREPSREEIDRLKEHGLNQVQSWDFVDKRGRIFDLSAADLSQIHHIITLGLFVKKE